MGAGTPPPSLTWKARPVGAWVPQLSMDQGFRTTHVPSQACRPTATCTGQTLCLCFLACKTGVGGPPVLR